MSRNEDIDNAIWSDPDFEALSADATLLYLWSFTNPRCGMAGIYKVSERAMTESKLPFERIAGALSELAEAQFAFYEESVLWVRTRVKHLRQRPPSIAIAIRREVEKLHPSHGLRRAFLECYADESWLRGELSKLTPSRHGGGTLSENPIGKPDPHTLSVPSSDGTGQGQGRGQGLAVVERGVQGGKQTTVDQASLPADFPADRTAAANEVLGFLAGVQAERGGNTPTLRGVGLAIVAYPDRDHVGVARELQHWTLAGNGQNKGVKDLVKLYRTFLEKATPGAPLRSGSGAVVLSERDERRARGLAALESLQAERTGS